MSLDRPNLADAFTRSPTSRAASLSGLLPPARPRPTAVETAPAEPPPPVPDASVTAQPTTKRPAPKAVRPSGSAPKVSDTADTVASIAVYLEPDLLERARTERRTTDITYDELVVRAFAAISDDELQPHFRPTTPVTEITAMPARQRRVRGTAGIQVQLRLSAAQTAWLADKQDRLGAPSRSALVATALRLYLLR